MIEFEATFGDERKTIKISHDHWGNGGYPVHIDNYYQGYVIQRPNGEWEGWFDNNDITTTEDIQIIIELVKAHEWPANDYGHFGK